MKTRGSRGTWLAVAAALALGMAAPAWASEPVSTQHILGELIPINESAEYKVRSIDLNIAFGYDSAELTDEAKVQIRELGAALISQQLDGATFGIYGHTDAKGAAEYNLALSEKRARAVMDFLLAEFDIDPARLTAKGLGETRLKNAEKPNAPENRRVQVVTLTPPTPKKPAQDNSLGGFVTGDSPKVPEDQPAQPAPTPAPEAPAAGGAIKF